MKDTFEQGCQALPSPQVARHGASHAHPPAGRSCYCVTRNRIPQWCPIAPSNAPQSPAA